MKPIRILNLFTNMNYGGAETLVMNYYRNLDRTKVQFDFMVHREQRGAYDDEIEALGGNIYRMIPIYPQNFAKYKKMITQFFDEHDEYQIIHSHMSELGYFVFQEAKKRGIPVRICHAHNTPRGWDMKMLVRTFFKIRNKEYITHMFVCSSEAGKWLFGKDKEERFIMMNNAIDAEAFRYRKEKRIDVRSKLNLNEKLVVGHVGRFNTQKNHPFLIEVFDEIHKLHKDSVLLLIGNGEEQEKIKHEVCEKGLENSVQFLGLRNNIADFMQAFDVFLFPSLYEGFGIALLEAQAAGLPCFFSEWIPEECIMTENVQAISLNASAKEWARKILDKVKNYQREDTYQKIVDKGFDIKTNAKWLETYYLNLVDER